MDLSSLIEEYNYFISIAPSEATDICMQDIERLKHPYPNSEIVKNIRNAFLTLYLGKNLLNNGDVKRMLTLPPLKWDFVEESEVISESLFVVSLRGMKFFMKREDYTRYTDWTLHEYFVGFNLPRLPTLALVLGAYSCNFDKEKTCKYQTTSEDGLNFVLYEYLDGKTLSDFHKDLMTKSVKDPKWYVWQMLRMVWTTINYLFGSYRFVHQDLHFGNIIVIDLGEEMNVKIGPHIFTTRYLPKIIDYGRSKIRINGKIYSPTNEFLSIPALTPYHDLRMLLRSFNIIDNFQTWEKLGFGNDKQNGNEYYETIMTMPLANIRTLYYTFDKLYPEKMSLTEKELTMDVVRIDDRYLSDPCPSLVVPEQSLVNKYKKEHVYYSYLRLYGKYLEDIATNKDINKIYLSLKRALMLQVKHNLEEVDDDIYIYRIFNGDKKQILSNIKKIVSENEFKELNNLYEKFLTNNNYSREEQ